VRKIKTEEALEKATSIFADNLRSLLLVPPLTLAIQTKRFSVLGVDPGFRTG